MCRSWKYVVLVSWTLQPCARNWRSCPNLQQPASSTSESFREVPESSLGSEICYSDWSLSWFSSVPQGSFWGRPGSILPYPFQFIINIIRRYSLKLLITSLNKPQTNPSFSAFMYHSWEMVRDSLFEPALVCWSNELWFSIPEVGSRQYCYTRHWHMFLTNDSSLETVTCL
jgi:hypothetical protein